MISRALERLAVCSVVALGCATDEPAEAEPKAEADSAASAPIDPRPHACGACHAEELEAWKGSMHARAWDDPVFRLEYDARPHPSCRDCHAPVSSAPGRTTGVDCATCHLEGGEILAVHVSEPGLRAHPMRLTPALGTPEHCGDCHQFAFENDGVHDPEEALQSTLEEYRGSDAHARGHTCQSCHMPDGSHALRGIHDPQMLARAVDVGVVAHRSADGIDVAVTLRGANIGHAFPTGDVFRRAVLSVRTDAGVEARIEMQRWLARTTDPDGEDLHVRTVDDTRVPAPGKGVLEETLVLADPGARTVTWELVLHRLPPGRAARGGLDPSVTTRLVARGEAVIEPQEEPAVGAGPDPRR